MSEELLDVVDLTVHYRGAGWRAAAVRAVENVTFSVSAGETVALVGESGSGKSTIGRAVLGLVPLTTGSIRMDGVDLSDPGAEDARASLQAVFQDPYSSLNPSRTIGATLREPLEVLSNVTTEEATERVRMLLERVSLPPDAARRYPRSFSGGQRQRIGVARALTVGPRLVVCDEATSALDLITRANIMTLLAELQAETGVAYLFIAHDLALVASFADRVIVVYRGRVMEQGPARAVNDTPLHPYTRALIAAVPSPDPVEQRQRRKVRAATRAKSTANAKQAPHEGCPFAPRCPSAAGVCWSVRPRNVDQGGGRTVACHLFDPSIEHPGSPSQNGAPRP